MSTAPAIGSSARRNTRRLAAAVAIAAGAIAASVLWLVPDKTERQAIERLDAGERRALYERTLQTLQSSCAAAGRPPGLEPFCREQAQFIVQFPECDEHCRSLAKPHLQQPTR